MSTRSISSNVRTVVNFLVTSDVDGLIQYFSTLPNIAIPVTIRGALKHIRDNNIMFDPTYDLLNLLLAPNNEEIIGLLIEILSNDNTVDKVIYILDTLGITSERLDLVIENYYPVPSMNRGSIYTIFLSKLIDYLSSINKSHVLYHLAEIESKSSFVTNDVISYITFRLIDDDTLLSLSNDTLEKLIKAAILSGHNDGYLVEILLKYLQSDSKYQSKEYRDNIVVLTKAPWDTSLLHDDV